MKDMSSGDQDGRLAVLAVVQCVGYEYKRSRNELFDGEIRQPNGQILVTLDIS